MNIKPLGDRVLVKIELGEEKSAGGIIIPQTAQEKTQTGVISAVGESEDITVKTGDKVMYDKYAGTSVKIEGDEFLILQIADVLAIIE
ncbi:MAG: co-chaperone GroES [Spirochaetia bacterium]